MTDSRGLGHRLARQREWKPTARQKKALEHARERVWDYSVTELAGEVGIARSTYYKWFEGSEFRRWWQREWERFFAVRMGRLWGKVFAAACGDEKQPSAAHAKLIIERFDKGLARNGTANGKQGPPLKTYVNIDVARVTGRRDDDGAKSD